MHDNGFSTDEFAELRNPDRKLSISEKRVVSLIRKQIPMPTSDTMMKKVIPQSDIYNYLYNSNYKGVQGFTAVKEHSAKLKTLKDNFDGARLDYNNTAFKTTEGIDGISRSTGKPDKYYGTIEYKVNDPSQVSVPAWKPKEGDYPFTSRGFTGSKNIVLPEYFQKSREFQNGDILNIINSNDGKVVAKLIFSKKFGWIRTNYLEE